MTKTALIKLYLYNERKRQIQQNSKILREFTKFIFTENNNSQLEIYSEDCFYILFNSEKISTEEFLAFNYSKLEWLFVQDVFKTNLLKNESNFENKENFFLIEVGPRCEFYLKLMKL